MSSSDVAGLRPVIPQVLQLRQALTLNKTSTKIVRETLLALSPNLTHVGVEANKEAINEPSTEAFCVLKPSCGSRP